MDKPNTSARGRMHTNTTTIPTTTTTTMNQPAAHLPPISSSTPSLSSNQPHNPLICFMCNDFYKDPCLMNCFHSFCARCLNGRDTEGKIQCPLCGKHTPLKDGSNLPQTDILLKQLIDLFNSENPPCANCDKRNKTAMYFCHTCGQALCSSCKENTHKAKMFSTHDVFHISKCSKEQRRRCAQHGELFIMFSNTQKNMLCINCFRDTPTEARLHCVDIDTAYAQSSKKLERAVMSICELQGSVREGMVLFRTLLEELKKNMDMEKVTINSFCQGMQEAIARTHASMIMEVQRQFETKEKLFTNQLVNLASILPILQMHLLMCTTFATAATKYEFLEIAYPMMERLTAVVQLGPSAKPTQNSNIRTNYRAEFAHSLEPWVGAAKVRPPPEDRLYESQTIHSAATTATSPPKNMGSYFHPPTSKRQHSALRAKALDGEGPFSNHCRSFDAQVRELTQHLAVLKDQLQSLHREVISHRPSQTSVQGPGAPQNRLENIARDCTSLEEQLERHQVELERLKHVFDTLWEEQLCRIHVEQDIFQNQMQDILQLRSEVRHLGTFVRQLEPYVRSLGTGAGAERLTPSEPGSHGATPDSAATMSGSMPTLSSMDPHLQNLIDRISLLQMEHEARIEMSQKECRVHSSHVTSPVDEILMSFKEAKEAPALPRPRRGEKLGRSDADNQVSREDRKGEDSGRATDMKRGMIGQLINKVRTKEERNKKSPGQSQEEAPTVRSKKSHDRSIGRVLRGKASNYVTVAPKDPGNKMSALYQSISSKISSQQPAEQDSNRRMMSESDMSRLPGESLVKCVDVEKLELQLREKLHDVGKSVGRMIRKEGTSSGPGSLDDGDYPKVPPTEVRAVVHREQSGTPATSPRRISSPGWQMKKQSSCESLSLSSVSVNSRRSSNTEIFEPPRSASAGGKRGSSRASSIERRGMQKQRSWETFPPKRGGAAGTVALAMAAAAAALAAERAERLERAASAAAGESHRYHKDTFQGEFDLKPGTLKKADSFEGHEEAVRTLVAAVQETRTLQRKPK